MMIAVQCHSGEQETTVKTKNVAGWKVWTVGRVFGFLTAVVTNCCEGTK
jgi:hypothetical protein